MGYEQYMGDSCIYQISNREKDELSIIAIYLDNIIITSDWEKAMKTYKEEIALEFSITDLGELALF
jgi:uncharacterized protein YqeY